MNDNLNNLSLTFKSEFGKEVRVVGTPDQPLFVAKDIAEILGYKNTNKAIQDHTDEEDRQRGNGSLPLSIQAHTVLVNESGVYSLILRSKLPAAKQFKRWVTAEVLPSIRKQGGYALTSEFVTLQREFHSLKVTHERFIKSTNHKPVAKKKGECVYVFDYAGFCVDTCKFGVTTSIAARTRTHRTMIPTGKVIYLVYTPDSHAIEEMAKAKFAKKRISEVVRNVPVQEVVDYIHSLVTTLDEYEVVTNIEADIEEDEATIDEDEEPEEVATKTCFGCHQTFPLHNFWRDNKTRDGYRARCADCSKVRQRELRAKREA